MYAAAEQAFGDNGEIQHFQTIYEDLSNIRLWGVFRGGGKHWNCEQVHQGLMHLDQGVREICLSEVDDDDWQRIWNCAYAMRDIKQNKSGPSLVAISKILHFWNPRLFVMFDDAVMESYVFRHKWLADELPTEQHVINRCNAQGHVQNLDGNTTRRLCKYAGALMFANEFLQHNQGIREVFAETAHGNAGNAPIPDDIQMYDAVAVEWCLQGLVELQPEGVEIQE